jgi:hypothetical protein
MGLVCSIAEGPCGKQRRFGKGIPHTTTVGNSQEIGSFGSRKLRQAGYKPSSLWLVWGPAKLFTATGGGRGSAVRILIMEVSDDT